MHSTALVDFYFYCYYSILSQNEIASKLIGQLPFIHVDFRVKVMVRISFGSDFVLIGIHSVEISLIIGVFNVF